MTRAAKATRGSKVTLAFGLMSIPVTMFAKTTDYKATRKQFCTVVDTETGETTDYHVGRMNVAKNDVEEVVVAKAGQKIKTATGDVDLVEGQVVSVPNDGIEPKYATEYGFVYVSDSEIEQLFDLSPKSAKIKAFQPMSLWMAGAFVPKTAFSVEVTPTEVGKKKVPNKDGLLQFQLILDTMREQNAVAVVEVTSRGIPKPAILLPDGTLWIVCSDEEVREARPEQPKVEIPDPYYDMVRTLIKSLWNNEPVSLSDTRTTLIQSYADEKAQAGDFTKPVEVEPEDVPVEPSVDLMAILTASVEAAKVA